MGKRIVIMAGGTGGHVFPALAVAQLLIEKGWQVSWLGSRNGLEARVIPEHGIEIDWLSVAGVRGKGLVSKIKAVFMLLRASLQAAIILRRRKPNVILGMGGFVAGPGGLMAKLLGIPLVIHEQNRIPGTTNRLLARLADQVLEAFPNSFDKKLQAICTGNPLRKAFLELADKNDRNDKSAIHILIFGGSQGAKILNEVVPDGVASVANVHIIHQTGSTLFEQVRNRYRELGVKAHVTAFIDDMVAAYQWADIVICRSGAMTVSEVAAMAIPAIFVPLPSAIDDHQVANARYLTDVGAGLLLLQKDLTPMILAEKITQILSQLELMQKTTRQCARLDATETVAAFCIAKAKL